MAPARRRSRFDRDVKAAVAILVGLVAISAAVFGTLEADASKQQERANVLSARLATQVFEATAVVSSIDSFALNAQQDEIVNQLGVTAHALTALQANRDASVPQAEQPAEDAAAQKLTTVIGEMTDPAKLAKVPDAHTARTVTMTDQDLANLVAAQNHALDVGAVAGNRSTGLVYALSLVALAGVLAGLAGVLRRGAGAILALLAGFAALIVAVGIGAVAMLS